MSIRPRTTIPDFSAAAAKAVAAGQAERAVLICGSGVGASIAANKVKGARAGLCHDTYSAHQGVEHDDMNILVLGSRIMGPALAEDLVKAFLGAKFSGEARHSAQAGEGEGAGREMTRQDLQELAEVRLKDARVLSDAGRFSGAYYIAGYAVECALKACIAKQFHEHEFPDLQKVKQIYTHGYYTLVRVAGLDLATE